MEKLVKINQRYSLIQRRIFFFTISALENTRMRLSKTIHALKATLATFQSLLGRLSSEVWGRDIFSLQSKRSLESPYDLWFYPDSSLRAKKPHSLQMRSSKSDLPSWTFTWARNGRNLENLQLAPYTATI